RSWPTWASASCGCWARRASRSGWPGSGWRWSSTSSIPNPPPGPACRRRPPPAARGKLSAPFRSPPRMSHYEGDLKAPAGARFAIVASRWNPRISDALVAGARETFAGHGVAEDAVDVVRVPGAWEIPTVAARIAAGGEHAGIVALGCVIRGDTRHFEHVADRCADGLMRVRSEEHTSEL